MTLATPRWDLNWSTIWDRVAATVPDEPAIIVGDAVRTFREFEDRAARLAAAFTRLGIGRGDKVGICSYNLPEYLEAVYAAFKLGAVPVNMNFRYRAGELADLLRLSRARAVVYPTSLRTSVAEAVALVGGEVHRVEVRDDDAPHDAHSVDYEEALRERWDVPDGHDERSGADEMFMFTGGTTGKPKAVVWRHGDLLDAQLVTITQPVGLPMPTSVDDILGLAGHVGDRVPRTLPLAPFMHATALFMAMDTLVLGGAVVLTGSAQLDAGQALRTASHHRATGIVIAGNAIATPLVEAVEAAELAGDPFDLSALRTVISSGMAWTDDRKAQLVGRFDVTLMDILGSSEGGPYAYSFVRAAADLPSRLELAAGAVVLGEDGHPVAPGGVGTLAYRGPMPTGYFEDPEKSAATYRVIDGVRWVTVGDWARLLDDRGGVELLGRGAAVVNTGGEKVYPAEVEEVLLGHPAVVDAAVFGIPDPRWGQQLVAAVATRVGVEATVEDLQRHVEEHLAGYKKPRRIAILGSLERSPAGKVDLARLAALASDAPAEKSS
jgi:acyl-CoA synthetase (AMP-forming)/AMP-acid ligase II